MKKSFVSALKTLAALFIALALFSACAAEEAPASGALDADTSYAFGMFLAINMKSQIPASNLSFDYQALADGFRDLNEARETRLTPEAAQEKLNAVMAQVQAEGLEEFRLAGEKNIEEGKTYLEQNKGKPGVSVTPSGLQYEVITEGSGARPGPEDTVLAHYEGSFITGEVFDSSFSGEPMEMPLGGGVIAGMSEGIQLMTEGSTYVFVIPPDLAYGAGSQQFPIPNKTLIFRVELISIVP